jgi:hypothetical protein
MTRTSLSIAIRLVVGTVLISIGCSAVEKRGGIGALPDGPEWVASLGAWEEQWNDRHPAAGGRYLWVVGTSDPVESVTFDRNAERSASDQAVSELVRALGISVNSLGLGTDAWSNETRDLVIGSYKEALQAQLGRRNVNLRIHEWYAYETETPSPHGGMQTSYLKKGLFRLDKQALDASLADETVEEFAGKLRERVKANAEVQKELVDRAKQLTTEKIDELTSE